MRTRLVVLLLLAAARPAAAQNPFTRELTITFLDQAPSTRSAGMGATGVSDLTGFFNPATLAWANGATLSHMHREMIEPFWTTDSRFVIGHRAGADTDDSVWRFGATAALTTMSYEFEERTIFLPEGTGNMLDDSDILVTTGIGIGRESKRGSLALGTAAKYMKLGIGDGTSWLFDFGIAGALNFDINGSLLRPRFGVSVLNLDTGLEYDDRNYDINGSLRSGVGLDFRSSASRHLGREVAVAGASFSFDYVGREGNNSRSSRAFGCELSVIDLIHARAGYVDFEGSYTVSTLGLGMGWAFGGWAVSADYAHVARPTFVSGLDTDEDIFGLTVGMGF